MKSEIVLELQKVSKKFTLSNGESFDALRDINISIQKGEFVSIIGPSGCGKSTLIKLLASLTQPTKGQILKEGSLLREIEKDRGVIFQNYNLFPWLTVEQNIEFGLRIAKIPEENKQKLVTQYLHSVGLSGFRKAYPRELSGGMQQRVALARTFVTNPRILLMDEPFAALDVQAKRSMQALLLQIWNTEKCSVIFVTHDVEEAIFLSDTVYVLTAHPGTVREKIEIKLKRPRDFKTEFSPHFLKLKEHIKEMVFQEFDTEKS